MKKTILKNTIKLLTVLNLISCTSLARNLSSSNLEIESFTANEAGFLVNSHLIKGKTEAILVDAQFTRSQAQKVIEMVEKSQKTLKSIYITHAHPDHYLGLELLSKRFPNAKILAKDEVIVEMKKSAQGKLDYWKPIYKDDLADEIIFPEVLSSDKLILDGVDIEIHELGAGESAHDTVLYIPTQKTLISGDTIYGEVHFWLAENRPEHVLENFSKLQDLEINEIYSGHGKNGKKDLIQENINYVEDFISSTAGTKSAKESKEQMLGLYPDFGLPIILDLSTQAVF